jgi:hypothetical protein
LFKPKATTPKDKTPEPVPVEDKAVEEPTTVEGTAVDTTTPVIAAESSEPTEETTAETPAKPEKSKRQSIFAGLIPKKDTKEKAVSALPNGESTEPTDPATEPETEEPTTETKEVPKKEGLGRRLTTSLKSSFALRAKSPDKGKTSKVADEAPKIDTAIESTPEATTSTETPEVKVEEPLETTEAPLPTTSAATTEENTAPVVSTLA